MGYYQQEETIIEQRWTLFLDSKLALYMDLDKNRWFLPGKM